VYRGGEALFAASHDRPAADLTPRVRRTVSLGREPVTPVKPRTFLLLIIFALAT
jgi:hypothetical protein